MSLETTDKTTLQRLLLDALIAHPLSHFLLENLGTHPPIQELHEVRDNDQPNWHALWPQAWRAELIRAAHEVETSLQARYRLETSPPGQSTF